MMNEIIRKERKYLMQTYRRQPISIKKGRGMYVWDFRGKKYLDFVAGIAVNNLGHCHPEVVSAIKKQAGRLIHSSNLYFLEEQVKLAEEISRITNLEKVFFCNSGAEAVEGALKLAVKAKKRRKIIAAEGSFHGRTLGALSITYEPKFRRPFSQILLKSGKFVQYNSAEGIRRGIDKDTAAVILEPVQGESGVRIPSQGYLKEVKEICEEEDVLLILDEIQTGFGRTGKWFCKDYEGVTPEIMVIGKALGGGLPLAAIVAEEEVANAFLRGDHGSTFGGNPVACNAGLTSINVIRRERLVMNARKVGAYFLKRMKEISSPIVKESRGIGLMVGCELKVKGDGFVDRLRGRGILINCTAENVLRFLPPLIVGKGEVDKLIDVLGEELEE
jgi:acetylornithine/N-succinyldiaminopimelate aminotransferase